MNVPTWVKLAAASKDELLAEVILAIEELGGMDAAQAALRQLASEKTSNWASAERFVISAEKTRDQLLEEFVDAPSDLSFPDKKDASKPKEISAPKESPKESPRKSPEVTRTGPEKIPARGAYLAMLLSLLLGAGGAFTVNQLREINLEKTLADYKAGHDTAKVPGAPADDTPLSPPAFEMSLEEYATWKKRSEERIQEEHKRINNIKDLKKKKEAEEDLRKFEFDFRTQVKNQEEQGE